jgi:hypothetical protein
MPIEDLRWILRRGVDAMADLASWAAVVISSAALAYTIWQGRRAKQAVERLQREQAIVDTRQAVDQIVSKWRNTLLSTGLAVYDTEVEELLKRCRRWRDDMGDLQPRLIAHTAGNRTPAYRLVDRNVKAVMSFEDKVRNEIQRRGRESPEWSYKLQRAISEMQSEANEAIAELDKIQGADLLVKGQA